MDDLSERLSAGSLVDRPAGASLVDRAGPEESPDVAPSVEAVRPRPAGLGPVPLSFAQQRLWFLDRFEPGSPLYNISVPIRVRGALDVAALGRALNEVVRRHEVLRTSFPTRDGHPEQQIQGSAVVALPEVDLRDVPAPLREGAAMQAYAELARRPFDLASGPPVRATIVRIDDLDSLVVVVVHHIVFDGWSTPIFRRELLALLEAFTAGRPSPLDEPALQYADFAVWQRRVLTGPRLEELVGYWRDKLAGAPSELALPYDRSRPRLTHFAGATRGFELPSGVAHEMRRLVKAENATLFMGLLAAFSVLLHRYSGEDDIVVGTTVAGRTRSELEPLIGFFVNSLVLRNDLSGLPSFRTVLRRVRETCLDAYAHQELPFERLVEELRPERHLSRNPMFHVAFVLQNMPRPRDDGSAATPAVDTRHVSGTAKFDLTLAITEIGDRLRGAVEYSTDLFDPATIDRLVDHFAVLLDGLLADPDRSVDDVGILTPAERRERERWNGSERAQPPSRTLPQVVAETATRTPGAVAVEAHDGTLTYAGLVRRANQLANLLARRGLGADDVVALCLERSLDAVVAMLGIQAAGAAMLPLDPTHPPARLAYMIERSSARLVLAHEELAHLVSGGADVLCLDGASAPDLETYPSEAPAVEIHPQQLAWVVFTSGSTGQPKGAMVPHAGVGALVETITETFEMRPSDRVLQFASLSFDASLFELILAFDVGGTLVVERAADLLPGADLARMLARRKITVAILAPSALSAMAADGLPDLRSVIFAGEASTPELVARWARDHEVFNAYGPTETTIAATMGPWTGTGGLPLGGPVGGSQVYLLDRHLAPTPIGCVGELYVGGLGVGRGYAEQPDVTADRFVPDPFSDERGARMYRTGDLARFRNAAELEFVGRVDDQVKLRGFRIEPREVAAVLAEHPQVRDAAVVLRRDGTGDEGLVGYVAGDAPPSVAELRAFLKERVPDFMLPSAFVFLDELPLTKSGKVDRAALPAPERLGVVRRDVQALRTPLERQVAEIWCDVLGVDEVGFDDNFFDFGGHSLLATRLLARTEETFRVELSLRSLFLDATVRGLAAAVEAARVAGAPEPPPPILPQPRDRPLPLSFAQERLWFLDRLEPGSAFYSIPVALRLKGHVDRAALAAAFTAIAARHEVLRTTFRASDDGPVQVVAPAAEVPLAHHDLSAEPAGQRMLTAGKRIQDETRRPFDLEAGPLLRTTLVTLGAADHILLVNMHHIVADGWSVGVLVSELNRAYPAIATGAPLTLPELAVQYADFAIWQREWLRDEVLEGLVGWWRAELRGAPDVLELPADRPRPAAQLHRGASHTFVLPVSLARELHALARRQGATVFMVVLAAFTVLLRRYTGAEDVVVGTPVAGRRPQVEDLVGLFVNTLPLRCDLSGRPTFRTLLERVRETTLAAYAHQDLPFEQLVDALQPPRSLSHNPIFQVMFAWQDLPGLTPPSIDPAAAPVEEPQPSSSGSGTSKFDLTLFMAEGADGLRAAFEYDTGLFDAARIERMATHLGVLLRAVVSDPDEAVDALPVMDEGERSRVVLEGGPLDDDPPSENLIHALVEDQVRRTPDAVAVEDEHETLTYLELDRRATAVAAELARRGVGPEVVVAVAVPRSCASIVALLGVLKAGGAYLPLDPDQPPARLSHQLRQGDVRVVLVGSGAQRIWHDLGVEPLVVDGTSLDGAPPAPLVRPNERNLAYVIYTSGSTGEPKGVMLEHAQACRRFRWQLREQPIGPGDAMLHKTPTTFDVSVWEIFWPLCSGARLVATRPGGHRDVEYMIDLVKRRGVTVAHFVPSMLPAFVDHPDAPSCTALKRLYTSGEELSVDLAERTLARLGVALHNLYGPTETAMEVSFWRCRADPEAHRVPIGVPMPSTRLAVLDADLRPVPAGVPGELYIGGVHVARGYRCRPDLTAERFVPDPFGPAGARMYRSGDRALVRPDGVVEFLGRVDSQIKLRGIRIEPAETEVHLRTHPRVADALVVLRRIGEGDERLVAYLVPSGARAHADEEATLADDLRAHLLAVVPEYMIPTAYVWLDALPLNRSGKADRAALPEPVLPARPAARQPATPIEREVAGIWCSVLRAPSLDLDARFFEIGGNSLLAIQVTARVNRALHVDLPLRLLFEASTLGDFAAAVAEEVAHPVEDPDPIGPIVPLDEADLLARLDELSDEEVDALLAQLEGGPSA
jgi:amino acid adenylation domain-containing protein